MDEVIDGNCTIMYDDDDQFNKEAVIVNNQKKAIRFGDKGNNYCSKKTKEN